MRRLAAIVRAHTGEDARARDVAGALAAAHGTAIIAPDETSGAVDAGPFEKRPHTLKTLAALGLTIPQPAKRAMWYAGDYAFYGSFLADDDHDFYFMVEYDVGLRQPDDDTWQRLFPALQRAVDEGVDAVGLHFGPYGNEFFKSPYREPYKSLFAIVGLSRRALVHLYETRLAEQQMALPDPRGATHCEVFYASVLMRDGFTCVDLNTVLPGTYDRAGVNSRLITPIGYEAFCPTRGRLLHRVAEVPSYLAKAPVLAARHQWEAEFGRQLEVLAADGIDPASIAAARTELAAASSYFAARRAK